jgi:CcmD family protein
MLIAAAVLCLSIPALAQSQIPPRPSQDGFVPVDAPVNANDTIPAPRLVAIAYGFIWVVLFGYLWSVRSRLGRVEREMETVSRRVSSGRK